MEYKRGVRITTGVNTNVGRDTAGFVRKMRLFGPFSSQGDVQELPTTAKYLSGVPMSSTTSLLCVSVHGVKTGMHTGTGELRALVCGGYGDVSSHCLSRFVAQSNIYRGPMISRVDGSGRFFASCFSSSWPTSIFLDTFAPPAKIKNTGAIAIGAGKKGVQWI